MEIEEETTSNHQEQPVPAAVQTTTTTVLNETSIVNTNTITTSTEHESVKKMVSESNTKEEEDKSPVSVHKSEDTETIIMSEVVENEALSGGVECSVVVESVNVVVDDGVNVDNDDVAAVECGGGGENLMSLKDENEGDELEEEEGGPVSKPDQFNSESDTGINGKDGGDVLVDNVEGNEAIGEERVVGEVVKEEQLVVVKEEGVGDEQGEVTVDGVSGSYEKDMVVEDEEKCLDGEMQTENLLDMELDTEKSLDADIENDKLLITEVDTEKSLDTEMENEKLFDTEKETEKSLDTEIETVKSLDTEIETDKFLDTELEADKPLGTETEAKKSLDVEMEAEKSLGTETEAEKSLGTETEAEKSLDAETEAEKSLGTETEAEKSLDAEMENEKSLDAELENEKSLDTEMEAEKSLDTEMEAEKSLDTEMEAEKSLDTEMENEEEANLADEEKVQEAEHETESSTKSGGGKRKRGGKSSKATPKKTIEEDVCFICYDGGDLVLCDRRNCPKAYHPACVNRDEAFFQSKGSWHCGWHLCSLCEKKAEYNCYTCTYSLCKACTKESDILCVREKEKKCLCEACMRTVMLIEKPENQGDINFDDKNSWEHLFKDYWIETKAKHNLSLAELEQAKNPWKRTGKQESLTAEPDIKDDNDSGSDNPPENRKTRKSKRNAKKQKSNKEDDSSTGAAAGSENAEWVSKDLLEFVTHMRNGDSSVISQYEVQDLLLEYIKRNKLRDPNRKSQIICDARLGNLFGKPRVAHIEMLKLLESHFLVKEDSQIDDFQGTVVDTDISPVDDKDKKRKGRKKSDKRGPQSNRDDYAAIDTHNISLIYLRRKLVEDLLDDMEKFHEIIVGTFVRIRISGSHQKQDMYRLVQVTGTSEAARYTLSKRTTCTMLEILNLDKTETISIDNISNQDFMEDECKRLRQSIKCGLISRLTVGDVLDKAMGLQPVRVNDWFETEVVRLNHLRDRASDLGRKKELRECVEKLNLLKTPEERARRLEECPLVHDDPTMDPEYGSEDDTDSDDKKQDLYKRSDSFRFNRRGRDQFSPRGDYTSKESWSGTPRSSSGKSQEFTESWSGTPRGSSGKNHEYTESWSGTPRGSSAKNHEFAESWSGTPRSSSSKRNEFTKSLSSKSFSAKAEDATTNFKVHKENSRDTFVQQPIILEKSRVASPSVAAESVPKINESEKMWHYKDPSEKIQGPFSMVQLRKWSKNGYFPAGLKIWRKSDKEGDGILLTDALEGKFTVVGPKAVSQDGQNLTHDHTKQSVASDSRHEPANFPSTPNKVPVGWTGGQTGPLTGPSPPLIACGNKDGNLAGSIGVSTVQPHDSSTNIVSIAVVDAPQNIGQDVQNPVQPSQLSQQVTPSDSNMQPQMVQSVSGQNPQGWPQNFQPNPSMNMAGLQPLMYNQWPGVPNMVQNPVGNFMPAPQEQWGQQFPFPVNQPVMQQPQPQQPLQPNVNWGPMVANPNMGWVGPNTGNPMNWVPMVQGPQVPGTVDPTWAMQAGWVPQPVVQGMMPNQSWVATPTQGPVVAGNGNPGWVGPVPPGNNQVAPTGWVGGPGNQGAPIPNQGWVPPAGNQGTPPPPGNPNQNWGPRNHGGNWGGNENRGNFSGQKRNRGGFGFGGRSFNKQESFHRDGGSIDRDDGPTHKDSTSFQGDDARSSEQ